MTPTERSPWSMMQASLTGLLEGYGLAISR
jgi:hypothetical protein